MGLNFQNIYLIIITYKKKIVELCVPELIKIKVVTIADILKEF